MDAEPVVPSAAGEVPLELVARIQDAERRRISRELHDRSAHSLAVALQCLELHRHEARGPGCADGAARAGARLERAEESVRDALDAIVGLIRDLRRVVVGSDLAASLEDYLLRAAPSHVGVRVAASGPVKSLPDAVADQAFLILREAVRNALLHASPRRISVELTVADGVLSARVSDDGIGFEDEVVAQQGTGLLSMSERAELIGAAFEVTTSPAGTLVDLRVPLPAFGAVGPRPGVLRQRAEPAAHE